MAKYMSKNGYFLTDRDFIGHVTHYVYAIYNTQKIVNYSLLQPLLPIKSFKRRKHARKFAKR